MTLENVLLVSAILFAIGLYGALTRRSAIVVLMSIELMFNAVNIAAVAFSRFTVPEALTGSPVEVTTETVQTAISGHVFAIFIIAAAAAEVALGLALVIAIYRQRETADVSELDTLRG
ncbi:MAG: NADH-quinone oxidoreductase subunit NuoK [Chloroflexi bacterium]|nr:NADH-quinone oxidoreductase subunit NuoK [Chloroflexota bacterium]